MSGFDVFVREIVTDAEALGRVSSEEMHVW
jgi:hypothetical protein